MNDLVNNEVVETETTNEAAIATTDAVKAKKKALDSIKKAYFPSAKLADAQTTIDAMNTVCSEYGLAVVFNFDTEKEFPAGYGIGIVPISKRSGGETVTLGVAIAAIPDIETVQEHDNGNQFVIDAVIGNMMAKLANAVRPRGDNNETASSIPYSVDDFITSNRPEGVLLAFRTYAGAYVKVLKKGGLKLLTESILRQALQSKAFAEQQFPKVGQDKWLAILDNMIARAEKDGIAVGMLADWKTSRDSATLSDDDVDLSDLDFDDIE
jgi:hypothetical protein